MRKEEAWKKAKGYLYDTLSREEADEIIKALEQEPCDVISRERALAPYKDLNDDDVISVYLIKKNITELPPVTPIPIPDNATNKDVIKAMFPDGIKIDRSTAYAKQVTEDWLNSPYRKEEK